jgi:uncharacterized protein (DUF488 family)
MADHLEKKLPEEEIDYLHIPELGGIRGGYETHMESKLFRRGIEKMLTHSPRKVACLMCMEDEPRYCHRRFIAELLYDLNLSVHHITSRSLKL